MSKKWAYYNDVDKQKLAWVRELMASGVITDGEIDERPIQSVHPDDLRGFRRYHFFCGVGIWDYALNLAEWEDDRGITWTCSTPCPSFSAAGKGQGFDDTRHLWPEVYRLIRECKPSICLGEQVEAAIGHGWFDLVSTDLEAEDYAVGAAVLGACSVGGPHIRKRLYFCADTALPQGSRFRGERKHVSGESGARGSSQSLHSERGPLLFDRPDGRDGEDDGWPEAHGIPGTHREVCERPDTDGREPCNGDVQRGGEQRLFAEDCGTGDPCDTSGARLPDSESEVLRGSRRRQERRAASESGEASGIGGDSTERGQPVCGSPSGIARHAALTGATRGFWRDCDWWYGKDGKWRPIGKGITPLVRSTKRGVLAVADESSSDLGLLRDSGLSEPQTSEARVMRLKGYGDGIVAAVAAEFIRAYMEVKGR